MRLRGCVGDFRPVIDPYAFVTVLPKQRDRLVDGSGAREIFPRSVTAPEIDLE